MCRFTPSQLILVSFDVPLPYSDRQISAPALLISGCIPCDTMAAHRNLVTARLTNGLPGMHSRLQIYITSWTMSTSLESKQHLIEEIRLRDFRCFHVEQSVPLTPLTFLVGENSTGKSSFLAAVRAIWETAFRTLQTNFREDPYDLGSFSEIVHASKQSGVKPSSFEIGFRGRFDNSLIDFDVTFVPDRSTPYPAVISISYEDAWIRIPFVEDSELFNVEFGTKNGSWRYHLKDKRLKFFPKGPSDNYWSGIFFLLASSLIHPDESGGSIESIGEKEAAFSDFDVYGDIDHLLNRFMYPPYQHVFAGAPIRSSPRRIYDPDVHSPDPAGSHVPAFLAEIYGDGDQWGQLKEQLETVRTRLGVVP